MRIAQDHPAGSLRRMGPGRFAAPLRLLPIRLGAAIAGGGFLRGGRQPRPAWRTMIAVLAGILAATVPPVAVVAWRALRRSRGAAPALARG